MLYSILYLRSRGVASHTNSVVSFRLGFLTGRNDMFFKLLASYALKIIFSLSLVSCSFLGMELSDENFQSEEEEYYASQPASEETSGMVDSESDTSSEDAGDILGGLFSDSSDDEAVSEEEPLLDTTTNPIDNISDSNNLPQKKKWIPLKKIPEKPWKQSGKWVNAVYVVRPADDLKQISTLLFSEDKVEELKNFNPILKRRDPKVGDKIYYNSPHRPQDQKNFYHYYEDNNKVAQSYDLNAGDNIRTVAERLLGHKDSWKEIWATNPQVESKGVIKEAVTIQYWIADFSPATGEETVEQSSNDEQIDDPMMAENMPADGDSSSDDMMLTDEAEPILLDAEDSMNMDMMDDKLNLKQVATDQKPMIGSDQIKLASIALIIVIIGLLLAKIIRDRRNRSDFDFTQTHIDIDNLEE